jgi:hypothetical protein
MPSSKAIKKYLGFFFGPFWAEGVMWAPGQIEGMRVGGVSTEEATEPHSQRKATAVRSKTQSPAKAAVNPAFRQKHEWL